MTIPRIIHQIWWQGIENIPPKLKIASETWQRLHPGWEYKLWDAESMENLVKTEFPWFYEYYINYEYQIQRADVIRYLFLYKYGGIYVDIDILCKKSLEPFITTELKSNLAFARSSHTGGYSNWFIISSAGNSFWPLLWNSLIDAYNYENCWKCVGKHLKVMHTTGPSILNNTINKHNIDCQGLTDGFNNCSVCDPQPCKCQDCYIVNMNAGGWNGWDSKFYNFVLCNWKKIVLFMMLVVIGFYYCTRH